MSHPGSGARQFQNLLEWPCSPRVRGELTSLPGGRPTPVPAGHRIAIRAARPAAGQPANAPHRDGGQKQPLGTERARLGAERRPGAGRGEGVGGCACARRDLSHVREQRRGHSARERSGADMAGKAFRKFLPLFDRVLVERCAAETVTKGGIMIPEKAQGKVLQATVVAVGSGARGKDGEIHPVSVKVGEKVLLPEYGGTKIVLEDKDYYLFRDGDILGKYLD
ncbi:10 kDa heat shock protein, mitochondrial [Excalfactoria chinensis]